MRGLLAMGVYSVAEFAVEVIRLTEGLAIWAINIGVERGHFKAWESAQDDRLTGYVIEP